MPHSSGGGSHGGGSHGGGSHGGSFGGSHSGGLRSKKLSTTPFLGATRYVCYRNGTRSYIYSNYDITRKTSGWDFLALLPLIPGFMMLIFLFCYSFSRPTKLTKTDSEIVINDRAQVFDMPVSLEANLKTFYKKTGITPAVMTVYNEDWKQNYVSLGDYAYDLYVNAFDDETHWLIVYSQPKKPGAFVDWYWEGMQGDDTDKILTEKICTEFAESLQKYLTADSKYTVDKAISSAFTDIYPDVMKIEVVPEGIFSSILTLLFLIGMGFVNCAPQIKAMKYKDASVCPLVVTDDTCEYCGGIYVVGTCTSCPHCGAPLKPHVYTEEEKNAVSAFANLSKIQK